MTLPTGTVTFLFTDIEGSTKLWETQPDAMQIALERHDVLMRNTIETNGGTVFKTMGDAFCAAFATATDALEAALAAQQSLHQIEAGVGSDLIKVRMALHTGAADLRNEDYFGQPLNRVARLLAAGRGGQVLLSQATYILVRDRLPKHASLTDMGEHRLRDLQRSEQVFQLCHPGLPADFPALKSLDHLPNNLPLQLTSFIGRNKEIEDIKGLFADTRLLTLTGSGGSGKTRLSLQVAADVLEQYVDGVWLVELAPLADPTLVPQTVAQALNIREALGEPITKTLLSFLKDKQMLIVLDNCEHLLDASARIVDAVLHGCPKVKIMVSSREALGISGERAYRVPSLSLPGEDKSYTPESLPSFESVRLFIERIEAVKSDFTVTADNAAALASACRRLDGIPLAIELAAARVRSLSVEEINARLDQRFRLLTGGSRTALPRQQTLRAMIDWSYDLLDDNQRAMFRRLSVFSGGWTVEATEQVCAGDGIDEWEALDLLTSLADKSLVATEHQDGVTRYRLLETVRQYSREKLVESGDVERWRERHHGYFLALAEKAGPQLENAVDVQTWLTRLETEHDNLRAALDRSVVSEASTACLRLCAAMWGFWFINCHWSEGRDGCSRALGVPDFEKQTPERADVLHGLGLIAYCQCDYTEAQTRFGESLAIRRAIGNRYSIAVSLGHLGVLAGAQDDYALAQAYHEESLIISQEIGNTAGVSWSLDNLGTLAALRGDCTSGRTYYEQSAVVHRHPHVIARSLTGLARLAADQGDFTSAQDYYKESRAIFGEFGAAERHIGPLLNGLGRAAFSLGDLSSARRLYEESLAVTRAIGDRKSVAESLNGLGRVACEQGDYASARSHYEEGLRVSSDIGPRSGIAKSMEAIAGLAAREAKLQGASMIWGAAETLRTQIGLPLPPCEQERHDRDVVGVKQAMGHEAFSAAWEKGRAMTMEEAIELAMGESGA